MPLDPYGKVRPRSPSLKNAMVLDVTRGAPRARAWPSSRGKPKTTEQAARLEKWRIVQMLTKYLPAIMQDQYREAVKGTALLPRDLLTMSMYGRFAALKMIDGRKLYPMTARQDISESLDVISQIPGTILVRGPDYWVGLTPGGPGEFLASGPAPGEFQWLAATLNFAGCSVYKQVNQQILGLTSYVLVTWALEHFDVGGWFNVATSTSRLVVPTGVNFVEASFSCRSVNNSAGLWAVAVNHVRPGGGGFTRTVSGNQNDNQDAKLSSCQTGPIAVVAGDYFEAFVRSNLTRNIESGLGGARFSINMLG